MVAKVRQRVTIYREAEQHGADEAAHIAFVFPAATIAAMATTDLVLIATRNMEAIYAASLALCSPASLT